MYSVVPRVLLPMLSAAKARQIQTTKSEPNMFDIAHLSRTFFSRGGSSDVFLFPQRFKGQHTTRMSRASYCARRRHFPICHRFKMLQLTNSSGIEQQPPCLNCRLQSSGLLSSMKWLLPNVLLICNILVLSVEHSLIALPFHIWLERYSAFSIMAVIDPNSLCSKEQHWISAFFALVRHLIHPQRWHWD